MNPSARTQAAIEILDAVIAAAANDGPPADAVVRSYFKTRRYAGSKDRRAVRELVYRAIRRSGERPASGRAAMLGLAADDPDIAFGEGAHGALGGQPSEPVAPASFLPDWIVNELSLLVTPDEWPALLDRAPLDLRANVASTSRQAMALALGAEPTRLSPWGLRLPADTRIDDRREYESGQIEVQDEGSQLIALACGVTGGIVIDLCAGAGGKALALAAASPEAKVIACDTNRPRLAQLGPRAERAGAVIDQRLLDAGHEEAMLADLVGKAEVVLVDAPCSGSGTWRRNPEGRWRLRPERLDRVVALQAKLLELAVPLVRTGGALVYATCSILRREGAGQAADFLGRHSAWMVQDVGFDGGRRDGAGRLLTPGHDQTDGFFVARFLAP